MSNGWRFGVPRNSDDEIHDNLELYEKLDRRTKDKDVEAVRAYQDILALVNYTITNVEPK